MNVFLEQPSVYTFVAYDKVLLLRVVRDSLEEKDYELQQEEMEKQKDELKKKIRFYNIYGLQGYVSENFEKNKK